MPARERSLSRGRSLPLGLGPDCRHADSACWATSIWPKSMRKKLLRPLWTSGRHPASRLSRAPGSSKPRATRPSTASGGERCSRKRSSLSLPAITPGPLQRTGVRGQRDSGRAPSADLHLLPPRTRPGSAGAANPPHSCAVWKRTRLRGRFSSLRRPWRSGWCAPSTRFATQASRTSSPERTTLPSGSRPS